ncbi:MAG: hypothetical protein ACO3A2_09210 [Bdellovibrionia bacterium]
MKKQDHQKCFGPRVFLPLARRVMRVAVATCWIHSFMISTGLASQSRDAFRLITAWTESGKNQELQAFTLSELAHLKKTQSQERDPVHGKMVKWKGVLLLSVVEKALDQLSAESRAQIDLVVLKGAQGSRALLPRSILTKYPVFLAFTQDSPFSDRGPLYSIVPWSSRPRIVEEGLPLGTYFVPQVERIELANSHDQFGELYLKRRTDPSAMRGEKLVVQNCVSCHQPGETRVFQFSELSRLSLGGHPQGNSVFQVNEKTKKSISSYLNAYQAEKAEMQAFQPVPASQKPVVQ